MNKPFVSVIIATRNEEGHIKKCLDSVMLNDYPKDKTEILIVDGLSTDNTLDTVKQFPVVVIENKEKFTPFAWNLGIKNAKGDIVIILGAHTTYDKQYISKCVKYLIQFKADNVGGIRKTVSSDKLISKAIANTLKHPFGAGNSKFKTGVDKPIWTDTVYGGCFRKELFDKVGYFNEDLIRSSDMEFNLRLKKKGGKILLAPDILCYYYPRNSLGVFLRHDFRDGFWSIYPLKFIKVPLKLRHYIPLIFMLGLIISGILGIFVNLFFWLFTIILGLYILVSLLISISIALKEKNIVFLFLMPITFAIRHFAYGTGSLWGIIKLL